eukprot:TRINITY_DN11124_c0_g1_i1.p1 TRINITY_DN11124_c0_g1~~TRINITY_DN11124_c0_g1_i1.p1  ORF type:complete len:550 (-),score=110.40 TRINITY_DN11124_c0_g1_i1:234-1763(-)
MDAAKLCLAASRRLGYHLRRSSACSLRKELRAAQKAVDDSRRVILCAAHLDAEQRTSRRLSDLLDALSPVDSVAQRRAFENEPEEYPNLEKNAADTGFLDSFAHKADSGTQTEHLLRSRIHALALSKGTDSNQDFEEHFELHLKLAGPELNDSVDTISCNDPGIQAKITVNGKKPCFGELLWTTRLLKANPTVEYTLSTTEVLEMWKYVFSARGAHARDTTEALKARDWDDSCSEASTEVASSLGCPPSAAESSDAESVLFQDPLARNRAPPEVLTQRRIARVRRRASGASLSKKDETGSELTTENKHTHLPAVLEEDNVPPRQNDSFNYADTEHTPLDFETLHRNLQNAQLKVYKVTRQAAAKTGEKTLRCGCTVAQLFRSKSVKDTYEELLLRFEPKDGRAGREPTAVVLKKFLEKKSRLPGCEGAKAQLLLWHAQGWDPNDYEDSFNKHDLELNPASFGHRRAEALAPTENNPAELYTRPQPGGNADLKDASVAQNKTSHLDQYSA